MAYCSVLKKIIFSLAKRNQVFISVGILARNMSCKLQWDVKGILLDISGVLCDGRSGAIKESVEAVEKLRRSKIPIRFVTNGSLWTRREQVSILKSAGFLIAESEIFSPGIATSAYLKQNNLRPFLLVRPSLLPEFSDCDQTSPNCVVLGSAVDVFSYENMNKAFQLLLKSENPVLISMGKGKYYKNKGDIVMDLGGFTAALEYAVGIQAKVIGKPSPEFFLRALKDIGANPSEAVMVGDDISSDVHAAQKCGMKGVLVRTGKFRESDLTHPVIKPDAVVDNLANFVDSLLL